MPGKKYVYSFADGSAESAASYALAGRRWAQGAGAAQTAKPVMYLTQVASY